MPKIGFQKKAFYDFIGFFGLIFLVKYFIMLIATSNLVYQVTATTTSILNNTITSNKSFATTTGTNTMKYMTHRPNSNERNGGASHMDNLQSKCLQKNLMMSFRMQQFSSSLPRGDIVVTHLQVDKKVADLIFFGTI